IKISEKCVVLEEGQEEIAYDFLVIATGTKGAFPGKIKRETSVNEAIAQYEKQIELIKSAHKITVIGGGASGTELAGEIVVDYPKKEVTMVHSSEVLISPLMGQSFRDKVRNELQASGVKMVLGEKVTNLSELPVDGSAKCVVKTDKGSEIEADLVIVCIGLKVNSDVYSKALGDCMDESGSLKVRPTLQVEGHDNIFAVGDCANIDKIKMAYKAERHSGVVAKNIQALATSSKLKSYVEGEPMMFVTVGRTGGAFQVGPFLFGRRIVRNIKGRDLFVERTWSGMKQKLREENLIGNKD
ncbi:apoptosis-inducing factor 2-like, partial [Anneissia japonica]|uniref:apoptosis-inducing factor 2-like n=1 Tax=Anneissia japonica TaxID=1529436 RepID=UPI0014256E29